MAYDLLDARSMPCPYFRRVGSDCRCVAVEEQVVPSLHEREIHCLGARVAACPTFQARERAGAPIPETTYLQLWLAPDAPVSELHTPEQRVCS
jgi:hypothetical protein